MRYSLTSHTAPLSGAPGSEPYAAASALQNAQGGAATQAPVAPPAPHAPELPEVPTVVIPDAPPVMTREYLRALEHAREVLNEQLSNVQARRAQIVADLRAAQPAERPGLQQRLEVIDDRLAFYERKLAETAEPLASPEAGMLLTAEEPSPARSSDGLDSDQFTAIVIVFMLFVLFPLAIAAARLMWKRATAPRPKPNPADTERLERLEHAVDTIAIEIERVAEGQRYVTKLLTAEGAAAPLVGAQREGAAVRKAGSGSVTD